MKHWLAEYYTEEEILEIIEMGQVPVLHTKGTSWKESKKKQKIMNKIIEELKTAYLEEV